MSSERRERIRVLIVDDYPVVRMGVRAGLELSGDIIVVAEAGSGEQALQVAAEVLPDVILMDIGLPGMSGIEATAKVNKIANDAKVIMFTSSDNEQDIANSIAAGALGYCLKSSDPERLCLAIRSVYSGANWFDSLIGKKITSMYCGEKAKHEPEEVDSAQSFNFKDAQLSNLSERELQVLELLSAGFSNQAVALRLNISLSTVKAHVRNILKRLGVDDRTQAAVKAIRMRIVSERYSEYGS